LDDEFFSERMGNKMGMKCAAVKEGETDACYAFTGRTVFLKKAWVGKFVWGNYWKATSQDLFGYAQKCTSGCI